MAVGKVYRRRARPRQRNRRRVIGGKPRRVLAATGFAGGMQQLTGGMQRS
jgi:hypothetical protein